jgi:hypothetical protein
MCVIGALEGCIKCMAPDPTDLLAKSNVLEMSQGNSLCTYLYLKQAKMSFFFFFLLQNRRMGGEQNRSFLGGWYQWEGGKGVGGRIWCKYCVHMYVNTKMIPVETILGMGLGGIKESSGGGEFKNDILDTL